jgi:hypothetical protein
MRLGLAPATAFIVSAIGVAAAYAETGPVKGETVKLLISGGTVELDTPIGAKLPLSFAPDGTVTGTSVVLAFYLGSTTDRGRWWISGNKLCTKFNRWFDREQSCLLIRPEGRKFGWTKDNGDTGTASIISNTKRLYGSASALTGGISAAAMVRNAEERAAASAAAEKQAQVAAQTVAMTVPQVQKPKPRPVVAMMTPAAKDDPQAWLPMSAVKIAARPMVQNIAYTAPAKAVAAPLTYKVARVTPSDVLNVRGGPNGDAAIVSSIPPDARGLAMSGICQADWCPVSYRQRHGWVNRQFLELE